MTETKILPLLTWRSAVCDSDLGPTTRHVALTLSLWMNERAASAFPSVPTLTKATGLSERAVRTHLRELVNTGWLVLVSESAGRQRGNEYEAATPARLAPAPVAPLHLTTVTPAPPAGDPCTTCSQSLQELSKNSGGDARKRAPTRGSRIPETFEVTLEMVEWARNECPDVDWRMETKQFVDHYKSLTGKAAVWLEWNRVWKKWMRRQQGWAKRGPARTHL